MMRLRLTLTAVLVVLCVWCVAPAEATVSPGDAAPNFTKNELDSPGLGQVTPRTLADYSGKVIVFFLLGYS